MDEELKEYVCGVFNFDPRGEWNSIEHILRTASRVFPANHYMQACVSLAEGLAKYIDNNISKY